MSVCASLAPSDPSPPPHRHVGTWDSATLCKVNEERRANVLVVGMGPHARRNHIPVLLEARRSGQVGCVLGVDVITEAPQITPLLNGARLPMTYIEQFSATCRRLPDRVRHRLDTLVDSHGINAIIVSTEPSYHMPYAKWAVERGLSTLVDKPLSVHVGASVQSSSAARIASDHLELDRLYREARRQHPSLIVSVMCQRRYHSEYIRARALIQEVADLTGCPVTSIQSFHSDGQWRMPTELIDIQYHSFDRGYGKCAHSGYHFFDLMSWWIEAAEVPDKRADSVEIFANFSRPDDFLSQLTFSDYRRLFPSFDTANRYTEEEIRNRTTNFGEVDAFISLNFKSHDATITLGSINLVHNGYSWRGNLFPDADLYKGNGRTRLESHVVVQGPFQALILESVQAEDEGSGGGRDRGLVGLRVLRNPNLDFGWKTIERFGACRPRGEMRTADASTQERARLKAVEEFLDYVTGKCDRDALASELSSHRRATTIMAGTYLSAARRWEGGDPVARMDMRAL